MDNQETLPNNIKSIKVNAATDVSQSYIRLLSSRLGQKAKSSHKNQWQLTITKTQTSNHNIASSANGHISINEIVLNVCFSLKDEQKKLKIKHQCIQNSTSLPFDSNEILSFEQQNNDKLTQLKKESVNRLILAIRLHLAKNHHENRL